MSLQQEIVQHSENVWVLCLDKSCESGVIPPVPGIIDWYHNHLITKSLLDKKISLEFGDRTLIAGSGLLPCQLLVVFGIGERGQLTAAKARKTLQDIGHVLTELKEPAAWIVVSKEAPSQFTDELKKSRSSVDSLELTTITAG